jgi:UDP-N-acetylmuramoylalanine--D-glutamate ligase
MLKKHGVMLRTVQVWLGPGICKKHYVVDSSRGKLLQHAFRGIGAAQRKNGFAVDLRKGITAQLVQHGIHRLNIDVSTICTSEERLLPSARRDGASHANTLTAIVRHAKLTDLRGKRVVVYGLGAQGGGEAAVRYAAQHHARVIAADAKPAAAFREVRKRLHGLPVQYVFGKQSVASLELADVIIKNPGVPVADVALQRAQRRGTFVTSDIGLFRATSTNPVVAITGTKGKTTVATWLAALLRTREPRTILAGNVRHSPLLEPRAYDGRTPVVLELSSFQLEALDVPLAPKLALITNLYPDHLDRHKTMRAYAAVKARITEGQSAADIFIAPIDSEWQRYSHIRTRAKTFWTSDQPNPKANAYVAHGTITLRIHGQQLTVLPVSKLQRQDIGTVRCAVSVALAGHLLGYGIPSIREIFRRFRGVPERFEVVRTFKGYTFINNTTATNPTSAAAGIASVNGRCIVIAGGADKGLPMQALAKALNSVAAVVFLPGSATDALAPKVRVPSTHVQSMSAAVRAAVKYAKPGNTIILSPGAASFGLFRNEFDRGAKFVRAVRSLR